MDESGNLDFSAKGTRYFVLAAITVSNPLRLSNKIQNLKYQLLSEGEGGSEYEYFHASEDSQNIRNKFFKAISTMKSDMEINYIYADKHLIEMKGRGFEFYKKLGMTMTKSLLSKYSKQDSFDRIVLVFDRVLLAKDQDNFLKEIKPKLKEIGKPYVIYFHRTISDFNGQIADYCAWAKYVSLERGEMRPLKELENLEIQTFDILNTEPVISF